MKGCNKGSKRMDTDERSREVVGRNGRRDEDYQLEEDREFEEGGQRFERVARGDGPDYRDEDREEHYDRDFMEQQWSLPPAGEYRGRNILRGKRSDVINPWRDIRSSETERDQKHVPVALGGLGLPIAQGSPQNQRDFTISEAGANPPQDPSDGVGSNPGSESIVSVQDHRNQASKLYKKAPFRRISRGSVSHEVEYDNRHQQRRYHHQAFEESQLFPEKNYSFDDEDFTPYKPKQQLHAQINEAVNGRGSTHKNNGVEDNYVPASYANQNTISHKQAPAKQGSGHKPTPKRPDWYEQNQETDDFPQFGTNHERGKQQANKVNPYLLPVAGKAAEVARDRRLLHQYEPEEISAPLPRSGDGYKMRNLEASTEGSESRYTRLKTKHREVIQSNLTGKDMLGVFKYPQSLVSHEQAPQHKHAAFLRNRSVELDTRGSARENSNQAGLLPAGHKVASDKFSLVHLNQEGSFERENKVVEQAGFVPKYAEIKNYREKMNRTKMKDILSIPDAPERAGGAHHSKKPVLLKVGEDSTNKEKSHSIKPSSPLLRATPEYLSTKKPQQVSHYSRGILRGGKKSSGLESAETQTSGMQPQSKVVGGGLGSGGKITRGLEDVRLPMIGMGTQKHHSGMVAAGGRKGTDVDCVSKLLGNDLVKPANQPPNPIRSRSPISFKSEKVRFESEINQPSRSLSYARDYSGHTSKSHQNSRVASQSVSSSNKKMRSVQIDQLKLSHIVEQTTTVLAKNLHRVEGMGEFIRRLRKEVTLLGLGPKSHSLRSTVQDIVKDPDMVVVLHRIYGDDKKKVERVKKSIWRRLVLQSDQERKSRLASSLNLS